MCASRGIKNTGDLRKFLVETMENVRSGELEIEKALSVTRLASQVNESFYSEIKTARFLKESGKKYAEMGGLTIG